jgi:DMSO/TMAO reductase YedYZ molybdopterin-dependent catalytic subunit
LKIFRVPQTSIRLLLLITLAISAALVTASCNSDTGSVYDDIEWDLTLVGDEEIVLDFDQLLKMDPISGISGFFTSVGIVNGPFDIKGVSILDLCDLVGGVNSSEFVRVSAIDQYSMVFSYNQLHGDFITYDTGLHEIESDDLVTVLMYELDGEPLTEDLGSPLRIAIIGDNVLTEGHYWVKWIDKVEILHFD